MEESKSNAFMDFLNDPSQALKTTKFSIASAGIQFFALVFFAIIGASIGFRFENIRDIWNLDYWISVVVLLMEQLYAMNIGYDLGRSIALNSNKELATTNQQSEDLVEGVFDEEGKEVIRPLKKDSAYVDEALKRIMDQDKIDLVKDRMSEIIEYFETKLDSFKALNKNFYLFPKKIKVGKKKKRFFRKSSAIKYCEMQIKDGQKMMDNEKAILAVPDANVPHFNRFKYADLVSNQEAGVKGRTSRYHQKNEIEVKSKMFGKKALINIAMAMIGPAILFGATGGDQATGMIIYSIFLLFVQLGNGFKTGSSSVINVVLYNAVNRLKAIQDVRNKIPNIKKEIELKEKNEKELAKETDEINQEKTVEPLEKEETEDYNDNVSIRKEGVVLTWKK